MRSHWNNRCSELSRSLSTSARTWSRWGMGWSLGKDAPFLPVKRQSRKPRLEPIPITLYVMIVILSFADRETERIWAARRSRRFPSDLQHAALRKAPAAQRLGSAGGPEDSAGQPARGLERGSQGPACDPHQRSVAHLLPLGRRRSRGCRDRRLPLAFAIPILGRSCFSNSSRPWA